MNGGTNFNEGTHPGDGTVQVDTGVGKEPNYNPARRPGVGSQREGEMHVQNAGSDIWATSHPAEMAGIVAILAVIIAVGLIAWTLRKRR